VLPFKTLKCIHAIVACFKLHNKCIGDRIPMADGVECAETEDDVVVNNMNNTTPHPAGQQIEERLVDLF
jgi:hypothetical protein